MISTYNFYGGYENRGRPAGKTLRTNQDGVKVTANGVPVDSQKSKVYAWQRQHVYTNAYCKRRMGEAEIVDLITRLCTSHGLRTPKIRFAGTATSCYTLYFNYPEKNYFRFSNGSGRSMGTVLHEVAHYLQHTIYTTDRDASHSPYFVRAFVDLLVKHAGLDEATLLKSLKEARIKIADSLNQKVTSASPNEEPVKRGRGRPKGSKNKPKV